MTLLCRACYYLQVLKVVLIYVLLKHSNSIFAGGVIVYEDSPLVKSMNHGRVLVIDEIDKAPTEVVCILKVAFYYLYH